jgi:O-antigen/teichoic acid export membrane protein
VHKNFSNRIRTKIATTFNGIGTIRLHIRNLSLYLIASIISSAIGITINPFLAANLSPEDYAIIGYFSSFNLLFLPIISFSLLSYYSRNYFLIKEEERQSVLDTLLAAQVLIGLLGLLIVLFGFYFYMKFAHVHFSFFPFAILCFVPIFFNCFYNFLLTEQKMKMQATSFLWLMIVNTLLHAFFAIWYVVILHRGATGRFWAILIPSTLTGAYSFMKLSSQFKFNTKIFKDAIKFGWPISLSAILYYFLSGVDRAMLEKLNDNATFGYYNVAVQIAGYLYIFYTAISQTFEPDIYKTIAENKTNKLKKLVLGIVSLNTFPTLLFIIFAYPVIKILTYGKYVDSTQFAQIIAIKHIPMSLCFLVSNIIIGYGYPKVELINRAVGALISVLLFQYLIRHYGFMGAAWGQSIIFVFMTLISGLFLVYKMKLKKNTIGSF